MGRLNSPSSRSGSCGGVKAEVHEHRRAIGPEDDVAGLDVQVHHMLAVQVAARWRRGRRCRSLPRAAGASSSRAAATAPGCAHHDVGLARPVARATKRGTCGPLSWGISICSTSKPTMVAGSSPPLDARHLHDQWQGVAGLRSTGDAPEVGHATLVDALVKAVDPSRTWPGWRACWRQRWSSHSPEQPARQALGQGSGRAVVWRGIGGDLVIGHALEARIQPSSVTPSPGCQMA